MQKDVGLWIDHRKTVIVTIEDKHERTFNVSSNMEKHVRFSSSGRSKVQNSSQTSTAEDMRDRQFASHLSQYYDGIISLIRGADTILIFGPGEAKVELANRLKQEGLGEHLAGIETADKMTDHQITAKVRNYFQNN